MTRRERHKRRCRSSARRTKRRMRQGSGEKNCTSLPILMPYELSPCDSGGEREAGEGAVIGRGKGHEQRSEARKERSALRMPGRISRGGSRRNPGSNGKDSRRKDSGEGREADEDAVIGRGKGHEQRSEALCECPAGFREAEAGEILAHTAKIAGGRTAAESAKRAKALS